MIKSISLQNFQGHPNTKLDLVPGVNVITGPSNVGKSSIIRAVWWACRNKPAGAGDNYRHHDAPKGEAIVAALSLDNGIVCRFKKGTKNGYSVGGEELVAVRSDVPEEVSSMLDMADHNLQLQHHSYFLVADSPGEVAQKLNEVAGLDIIDDCLKNGATLAGRNVQETTVCEARIGELDGDIEQYNDVADRDERVAALENLDREVRVLDDDIEFMENTIGQLQKVTDDLEALSEFLEIENKAAPLFDLAKEIAALDDDIDFLQQTIDTGKRLRMEREALDASIKDREKEFHRLLKDSGVCPLCQQEIT